MAKNSASAAVKPQADKPEITVDLERLLKKRTRGIQKREEFRSLYQDIEDYSAPDRSCWVTSSPGTKRNKTYDSTAIKSRTAFANRIQTDMMPPFQRWLNLKPGEFVEKNKQAQAQVILDDANAKFYAVLQASNFDTAINEFLQDLAAGTAILMPLESPIEQVDEAPMNFYAVPPATFWMIEDSNGRVTANGRDFECTAGEVKDNWPDAQLTADMTTALSAAATKTDEKFNLFEICAKVPGKNAWEYCVVDEKSKAKIVTRSYPRNRFIPVRWQKMSGEVWGRGPLVNALPDIKTINKLVELILRQAALRIAGVWAVANDGVINPNNVVITPGATIPVGRTAGPNGPSISNIAPQGDIQVAELEREKLTMSIKEALFDSRLPPEAGAVRSATEIMQRVKELVKDIGAPFGRLMSELIHPLVQCVMDMLLKRALLKDKIVVDGLMVRAQILSPLAQVQNINDVENVVRWLQIMASFGTEIMYVSAKIEDVGDYIGDRLGVPSSLRRDEQERGGLQQTIAQLVAAKQQAPAVPASEIAQGKSIPVG